MRGGVVIVIVIVIVIVQNIPATAKTPGRNQTGASARTLPDKV
jgi:hypothetical protein